MLCRLQDGGPIAVAALLRQNRDWLLEVNGLVEDDEDEKDFERTWTRGLLECAANVAKDWSFTEQQYLVFDLLAGFSDEAFIDGAAAFLVQSDLMHIEGGAGDTAYLVEIRERLWERLKDTTRWRQHLWSPKSGMEIHLKELIAGFFFKLSHGFGVDTGYTGGLSDEQVTPFLPLLAEIAITASPCPTIALLFLDVLDIVSPDEAAAFLIEAAPSWVDDADERFWNELGIGRRVTVIAEKIGISADTSLHWLKIADAIAGAGVNAGEALKRRLQEEFR